MKYFRARQRLVDKRWDWTVDQDQVIAKAGPCVLHSDGHATREEAERHFYDWDLQTLLTFTEGNEKTKHECEAPGCKTLTDRGLATRFRWKVQWFCDLHRVKPIYEMLNPFEPGIEIQQS